MDSQLRFMIHERRSEGEMLEHIRGKCPSLVDSGLDKVYEGVTSLEEVIRVTRAD